MTRILIDTDVILDFFFDRQPFAENASKIFSLCESKKITGFVTPVIISNVYYLLRQSAKHEKVIEKLKLLVSITEIAVMDKEVVTQALNSDFKDFEDALQNYSAEIHKEIDLIITRNTKDFKNSKLAVMNPDNYMKINNSFNQSPTT
jgi:predicted nucleic acid-binding protein